MPLLKYTFIMDFNRKFWEKSLNGKQRICWKNCTASMKEKFILLLIIKHVQRIKGECYF